MRPPLLNSLRLWTIFGLSLLAIFAVLSFVPYPASIAAARRAGFSDEVIGTGLLRSAQSRLLFWGAQVAQIVLVCWLGLTTGGQRLAESWQRIGRNRYWFSVMMTALTIFISREMLLLPFGIAGFVFNQQWEMLSPQYSIWAWIGDWLVASMTDGVLVMLGLLLFVFLIRQAPLFWWCIAPIAGGAFAVFYALIAPLILDPLTNRFVPLESTEWKDLRPRLIGLVDRAKLPVQEILVMDASRRSKHTNAYFAGFGATRRIVLYDTLLTQLNADEIEAVLAHEIGHWENDHIVLGIFLGALGLFFGCWFLDGLLSQASRQKLWGATTKEDPRLLGVVVLLLFFGQWIVRPVENYISRTFEVQADIRSLELIDDPSISIAAERQMAIDNKSNVAPSPWNMWMFSTHPSSVQRIERASQWQN